MSSMRNAVQRRNHRERAQPKEREKWGILEKHKDYRLRARDFNTKKARLKALRQKAADRNPDEFYFAMHSSKMSTTDGTKVGDRGNKALGMDVVRLLKTQDAGYLRVMAQKAKKEVEMLEQEIHLGVKKGADDGFDLYNAGLAGKKGTANGAVGKHTVFVDSAAEQRVFKPEEFFHTTKEGLNKRYNRPRIEPTDAQNEHSTVESKRHLKDTSSRNERRRPTKDLDKWKKKLAAGRKRLKQLEKAEQALSMQRARMAKTPTVGGVDKLGRKWKVRERKK